MSTSESDTIADTEQAPQENTNRRQPFPRGFLDTISTGWADRPDQLPPPREQAPYAAARRRVGSIPR